MARATLELRGLDALLRQRFDLTVESGPDAGRTFEDLAPPIILGTGEGAQVRLSDPTVSRIHAAIESGPGGAVLVDHSSTNGIFLGPHRVLRAFLADGDRVGLGNTALSVRTRSSPVLAPMSSSDRFGELIGVAPATRALFALLERLAAVDAPVLVRGETGTGKELVARALHHEGARKRGPFVVFDCGAVAPGLVESTLFGHERGAFTGADAARKGTFVQAHGGTLFLDEIGELPLDLQPKLLRALESKRVRPLGADRDQAADVRVIAATHRDLAGRVNDGRFREDLYFRLSVLVARVPPLRDRREDLGPLTRHFLQRSLGALEPGFTAPEPTAETIRVLERLDLRGNVRELRNLVDRAVVLGDMEAARRGDLADALRLSLGFERRSEPQVDALEAAKRRFERGYLLDLVRRHGKDRVAAAREAGIHPKSLGRLLRRHGLTHEDGADLPSS